MPKRVAKKGAAKKSIAKKRAATKDVREEGGALAASMFEDLAEFGNGNLDALVEANNAALRGWEAIGTEVFNFGNEQLRESWEMGEALLGCGSPQEAAELQTRFARSAVENWFREATRLMEVGAKAVTDCCTPLETRATALTTVLKKSTGG